MKSRSLAELHMSISGCFRKRSITAWRVTCTAYSRSIAAVNFKSSRASVWGFPFFELTRVTGLDVCHIGGVLFVGNFVCLVDEGIWSTEESQEEGDCSMFRQGSRVWQHAHGRDRTNDAILHRRHKGKPSCKHANSTFAPPFKENFCPTERVGQGPHCSVEFFPLIVNFE